MFSEPIPRRHYLKKTPDEKRTVNTHNAEGTTHYFLARSHGE